MNLISTALKTTGSFLGGIQTYLIVGAVSAALAFTGGAYVQYRMDQGAFKGLQLDHANELIAAKDLAATDQHNKDLINQKSAVDQAKAQGDIALAEYKAHERNHVHVTPHQDNVICVSVGLVRVLNAAVFQTDPAAVQLAPGQSDDACSDVKASVLSDAVVEWLYTGHKNAKQLNDLIANLREKAVNKENVK